VIVALVKLIAIRIVVGIVVVIDIVTSDVAIGEQRRQQFQHAAGDADRRVALPELEERPRPATLLGWCRPSAAKAHRVAPLWVRRQDLLKPQIVLPAINEVVLIQEALSETQAEITQPHPA
jgi:hypothetical protein